MRSWRRGRHLRGLGFVCAAAFATANALADNYYYKGGNGGPWDSTGTGSTSWFDQTTATNVNVPPAGGAAFLMQAGTLGQSNVTVLFNSTYTGSGLSQLEIDSGNTLSQTSAASAMISQYEIINSTYNQSAGTNTFVNALNMGFGASTTYNLSGTGTLTSGGTEEIGLAGPATFNQSGGTHNVSQVRVGESASGAYNLSGGSLTVGFSEIIGYSDPLVSGIGTFVQTGGTHTVNGTLALSQGATGHGTYTMQGGTLNFNAFQINNSGAFTMTFGSLGGTGSFSTLVISSGGSFLQSGGTLTLTNPVVNQGNFTFSGGTFNAPLRNQGNVTLTSNFTSNGIENDSYLSIPYGVTVLTNGTGFNNLGTVSLIGGTLASNTSLVNSAGAFMSGYGSIGSFLQNYGTLNVAGPLASSASINNYGSVSIGSGANLTFNSSSVNLSNYALLAFSGGGMQSGSISNLPGATLSGYGYVSSKISNFGSIVASVPGPLTLADLTGGNQANGQITVAPGGNLQTSNSFTNAGLITLQGSGAGFGGSSVTLTNIGTISGAGNVNLTLANTTGTIRAEGGQLAMAGSGNTNSGRIEAATGNTVMFTAGLAANGGTIALTGGTFDNNNQPIINGGSILGRGTFRSGGLTNNATVSFADAATDVIGPVTNSATLNITNNTTTFFDPVTNNNSGHIKVTAGVARFLSTFTNNGVYNSDPSDNYFTDLSVSSSGYLVGGSGDRFFVSGNYTNNSTQTGSWNTASSLLQFQGGSGHQMTVAGSAGQFGWETIGLNAGDTLTINANSATAAATQNNGALSQVGGTSNLGSLGGTGSTAVGNASDGAAATMVVSSFAQPTVTVNATGTLQVAHNAVPVTNVTSNLTISTGGKLDLTDNSLQISYSGASPIATIRTYLAGGYNGGAWNGPGIDSSTADANHTLGYADSADGIVSGLAANTILVKYATPGDVNLDGVVSLPDLLRLVRNFGHVDSSWDQGDLNYDGTVNLADFLLLSRHFGGAFSPNLLAQLSAGDQAQVESLLTQVPEPNLLPLLLSLPIAACRRRVRK